jgi:hypothetical protein
METVPEQPTAKAPIRKTMPIVLVLLGVVVLIGASTVYNALTSHKKDAATKSALQTRPATADPAQVTAFERNQQLIARNDAEQAKLQQAIAALQAQDHSIPAPESDPSMPMTPAQARAIYGNSPNAPQMTSGQAEARAQAKQLAAQREKQRLDALDSGTVAVDFQTHESEPANPAAAPATKVRGEHESGQRSSRGGGGAWGQEG